MARPSKLSEKQWADIERRLLKDEKPAALAREYGIDRAAITRRFSQQTQQQKTIANQLATAEIKFSQLPIAQQIATRTLADEIKAMTLDMASAGKLNAQTAKMFSKAAHDATSRIMFKAMSDDGETISPERLAECGEELLPVMKSLQIANEAGKIPLKIAEIAAKTTKEPEDTPSIKVIGGMAMEPQPYDYPLPNKSDDEL